MIAPTSVLRAGGAEPHRARHHHEGDLPMNRPAWLRKRTFGTSAQGRRARSGAASSRPQIEALEDRCVPAVITWDGGGGDFRWENPLNWSNDALPGTADDV